MKKHKIGVVFCILISTSIAYADQGDEICFPLYKATGAIPGTSECQSLANTARVGMGTFFCTSEPDRIERYCQPKCLVPPLAPVTAAADAYENGEFSRSPDLGNVNSAVNTGLACIQQRIPRSFPTSGYRPQEYQNHLREVWDKWQLLKNDSSAACAKTKLNVKNEFTQHRMVHQPGLTSRHSSGNAVDISGVPEAVADTTAAACSMSRPVSKDPVHYEPH